MEAIPASISYKSGRYLNTFKRSKRLVEWWVYTEVRQAIRRTKPFLTLSSTLVLAPIDSTLVFNEVCFRVLTLSFPAPIIMVLCVPLDCPRTHWMVMAEDLSPDTGVVVGLLPHSHRFPSPPCPSIWILVEIGPIAYPLPAYSHDIDHDRSLLVFPLLFHCL